jgi:hypothetical protein
MSAITSLDAAPVPVTVLDKGEDSPAATDQQAAPPQVAVDRPAVIVSLSASASSVAAASATAIPNLGELDPNAVDDALSWAAGANGFAANYERADWSKVEAKFGNAVVDRDKALMLKAVVVSASNALSSASSSGIPIKDSVSPDAVRNGATPGTITVGAFSFTNSGSTYTITPGKDGTLIGTKDGQAWNTWQLTDPTSTASTDNGATAALQTLTSLNTQPTTSDDKSPSAIDISI